MVLHAAELSQLTPDPAWRGRGLGDRFVAPAKEWGRATRGAGRPCGALWTCQVNRPARRFHERSTTTSTPSRSPTQPGAPGRGRCTGDAAQGCCRSTPRGAVAVRRRARRGPCGRRTHPYAPARSRNEEREPDVRYVRRP
ncbi:GNAT family N-acetyltransferase [Streptomyces sp. NPDC002521]